MKTISTLLIGLIFTCAYSQIAIIKDKDGYTNVREFDDVESEIIYKLLENEAFWYNYDDFQNEKQWINVFIPKDKFCVNYSKDMYLKGYIHKSRLLPIEALEKALPMEVQLHFESKVFNKTSHIIDGNEYIATKIDGRKIWGTDGNYPKKEISKGMFLVKNTKIEVHRVLYSDLFECNQNIEVYKNKDTYFVSQNHNSDGAGTYEILWVLTEKSGITQRLVEDLDKEQFY